MVFPVLLITLGILLLANNLYPAYGFGRTWPVLLIVMGLAKVIDFFLGSIKSERSSRNRGARSDPDGSD